MPTNDAFTTLNPGVSGDSMDETAVTYGTSPTTRKRPRVVIAGDAAQGAIVDPASAEAAVGSSAYAVPTRQVGRAPVRLYDANSAAMDVLNGAALSTPSALLVAGTDGSNARFLKTLSDGTVATNSPPPSTLTLGQKTVAVANTAAQLTASTTAMYNGAVVQALSANVGLVYVGFANTTGLGGAHPGFELAPGQACPLGLVDLSLVYVTGATVGDGVCFVGS